MLYTYFVWCHRLIKKWIFPKTDKNLTLHISEKYRIHKVVAEILLARGFECDDITADFLNKSKVFYDPFLLNDMNKAVAVINTALTSKKRIAVYGDYDVDGITATYILYDYLKNVGADVIYYIPDRAEEGYGINTAAIDYLKSRGVELIITVDVGITAVNEVDYAKSVGIDVIITDHHTLKEDLPRASAVINPKITASGYPFDSLAGVGVAFKLIYAVSGCSEEIFDKYCDIAALGTIADMVPLCDENRYITSVGIAKLKHTSNTGLQALMSICSLTSEGVNSTSIGFMLAPRLNSAGRIAKAEASVKLLLEKDYEKALCRAEELNEYNRMRQAEEQKIFDEAIEIIKANSYENDSFILVEKEEWIHGVIGIVSSKITEKYYRPSAVVSINADGTGKASGRSIPGINLFNALTECQDSLLKFGGHELAAGFTVADGMIDTLRKSLNNYCKSLLTEETASPHISIDSVIELEDICMDTINALDVLEPYGIANKTPTFCITDVLIKGIRYTQNKKHAFLTLSDGSTVKELPVFSMPELVNQFCEGDYISVAGVMSVNTFRGITSAQLVVKDIHHSKKNYRINRDVLSEIFTAIKAVIKNEPVAINTHNPRPMYICGRKVCFNRFQTKTALEIFGELKILDIETKGSTVIIHKGVNFNSKTKLTDSATYNACVSD